jgi:hypothetical protein
VEWFRHHDRAENDEERTGENLEIDELRGRAEACVQSSDVGLIRQGEVAFYVI